MPSTNATQNRELRSFDGVICLSGGDYWYHNHGHYDMQMMRELTQRVPVLFVNSIGFRAPRLSEGGMFVERVSRKFRSLIRGLVQVRDGFWVMSPVAAPIPIVKHLVHKLAPLQIRRAAKRVGIRCPLVWAAFPPAAQIARSLGAQGLVYQRTDRWESYPGINREEVLTLHRELQETSNLTLYCASLLFEEERSACRNAVYLDHGVDYARFEEAGTREHGQPEDIRAIPTPRVGFVGGIDESTFDPELFLEVARRLPEIHFVCVGGCTLPSGWAALANVHLLGQRPYAEVAGYMAACDVLIMPWNRSEWIQACNPIKLKEYLAVGRPIVTTPFFELGRYEGLVSVANDPESFSEAIRSALRSDFDPTPGRDRVRSETWQEKGHQLLALLEESGLRTPA